MGLLALAAWYAGHAVIGGAADPGGAVVTACLAAGAGAVLLLLAVALARASSSARTPSLLSQVFVFAVGAPLVFGERWYVGVPMVILALLTATAVIVGIPERLQPRDQA